MQDGILFDNILIASDEKIAETYRETTWKPKFEIEKETQKAEDEAPVSVSEDLEGIQKKAFELFYKIAGISLLSSHKQKLFDLLEKGERQPNLTIGLFVSIVVVIFTVLVGILFGGKKPARVLSVTNNAEVAESSGNQESNEEKKESEKEESGTVARKRSTRREN